MNTFKTFEDAATAAAAVEDRNPGRGFSNCDTKTGVIKYGPKQYGVAVRDAYNLAGKRETLERAGFVVTDVPACQRTSVGPVWYAKR